MTIAGYGYIVGLIGALKASRGIEWAYPINLHLIRSTCGPETEGSG